MLAAGRALSLSGVRSPVLFLLLLAAVVIAPAQESASTQSSAVDFEGRTIGRIEFDPPNQPLPQSELERLLPFHVGSTLERAEIRAAIQSLYQTGRFSDIAIDAQLEGAPANGLVALRIATQPAFFVSLVTIAAVPEPPDKVQLNAATKLELGARFNATDVERATSNLMDRLRANGLYQAKITSSIDRRPATEEVDIHFDVDAGNRAHFDGVQLSGNFMKSPESIIHETRWKRGLWPPTFDFHEKLGGWREVTEKRVQTGVSRVLHDFERGDHLEAQVTLGRLSYHDATNTVTPSLTIESGPIVQVQIEGAKVSGGRLRQLIPVYQERAVDRSLLVEGQRNLLEYFQSQGYFDSQAEFNQAAPEDDREAIDYQVTLGERHKLARFQIEGNRFFDTASLRERLEITPASFPRFPFGRYSRQMLARDLETIRDLYHANGFRDADVKVQTEDDYQGRKGHISVSFDVQEGPQWLVGDLEFQGVNEAEIPYLRSLLQSTEGEPFSEVNVAIDRDAILNYYYNNGYNDAAFDWTETQGSAPHTVNLVFLVQPGRHEYLRGVLLCGLQATKPQLAASRLHLNPGDPLSQSRIAESQQRLYDLGIFSKVETAIQNPDGIEDSKYVLIRVDEADQYSFNAGVGAQLGRIGAGVTTFDEPAGTTGFVPRISLGLTRINFLGLAHTVSLQTRFSTIEQRAVLSYVIPQLAGSPNLSLTVSGLFDNSRDIRTFAARRWEGSVQLAQRITRAVSMQYRLTFRYVTLSNLVVSPELVPLLSQPERVGQYSMTFIQDRRDNPVDSHRGMYNTVDVGVALNQLGSQTVFTRLLMRNSTYHPIGRNVVIARTLQFGYIQRFAGLAQIPLAERFFAGGASSNRAFPDNQAGPRDLETGFPLGGNALLFHSTELRFPLIGDNLGGVLFHDMGNVYADITGINVRFRQHNLQDFDYMVQSVGFGIRYRTPIGPLRADFSVSPNAPRFFGFQGTETQLLAGQGVLTVQKINAFQFHFSLGQTF